MYVHYVACNVERDMDCSLMGPHGIEFTPHMQIIGSVHDWGVQFAQQTLEIFRKAPVPGAACVMMHVHADYVAAAHLACSTTQQLYTYRIVLQPSLA